MTALLHDFIATLGGTLVSFAVVVAAVVLVAWLVNTR
jgi:hypothetical protein